MTDILHNERFIRFIFISIGIATFIIYLLTALDAGQGNLLMPLDDVYIHFQYARQMATGHPYQYNLIDPPTSGATSLIYPYLLAIGYLAGFKGLWLGLWAMIIGTIAMIASIWAVYRLCKVIECPAMVECADRSFLWTHGLDCLAFYVGDGNRYRYCADIY